MTLAQAVEERVEQATGVLVVGEFGPAESVDLITLEQQFAVLGHHLGVAAGVGVVLAEKAIRPAQAGFASLTAGSTRRRAGSVAVTTR